MCVNNALDLSKTLRGVRPVQQRTARKYVYIWKETEFLEAAEEKRRVRGRGEGALGVGIRGEDVTLRRVG